MPRKAPPDIGTCPCPTCGESRPVRKEKTGRLYIWCASPCESKCTAQDYILSNAKLDGKAPLEPATEREEIVEPVAPVPVPEPGPEPSPSAPEPKPKKKKKRGFFDFLDTVLED